MRFTKMQGAGNDYVYLDCVNQPAPTDPPQLAREISDRHFGVGSDGLILIHPSTRADVRMQMLNADGSEAQMCGNGIRCVAKYTYDHGLARKERLAIETKAGVLSVDLSIAKDVVEQVTVAMGGPILEAARVPVLLPGGAATADVIDASLTQYIPLGEQARWMEDCQLDPRMTCVSMGNPHVVIYCGSVAAVPLETIGPILELQPIFPERINVHFVEVRSPEEVVMRTWERGSGVTLACGTGACAVCVAGVLTGRTARRLLAHLPGGDLTLHWDEATNQVMMTGPAVEVFSGEWPEAKAESGKRKAEVVQSA
ncbi:MAG: diaminopimelate epimerase [Planctomycetia bacterium]|nr:diaminopimelate epimerase [Planctomycetia bacterium]